MKRDSGSIGATWALPDWRHLFSGAERFAVSAANDKHNGTGDSAGKATNVKAPGGSDAARSRDGG
jgi:hypothetical protein